MTQLVQPDLGAVGYPNYCLAYVEEVFGMVNDHTPDATTAWNSCKFRHTDALPTDASFPVWFSWTGTIDGVTKNYGHVAVSTPQGVYTNPLSGSGHKVYASVPALEKAYGVKYVGWSEDISNLRVVEEDDMSTIGDVEARILIKYIYGYINEVDIEGAIPGLLGGESNTVIRMMDATPTAAAYQTYIADLKKSAAGSSPTPPRVLGPGTYQVK